MRGWVLLALVAGVAGGAIAGLVEGALDGAVHPCLIIESAGLWGAGLTCGVAAAYIPSYWVWRGLAGGVAYGLGRGGLTIAVGLSPEWWGSVLISEVIGGLAGGLFLAYVWRHRREDRTNSGDPH